MEKSNWERIVLFLRLWECKPIDDRISYRSKSDYKHSKMASQLILNLFFTLSMFLSVVWVAISFDEAISENDFLWFQRSGAILVLFSVMHEYFNKHYTLHPTDQYYNQRKIVFKIRKTARLLSFVFVCIGTLIWSYGDHWLNKFYV